MFFALIEDIALKNRNCTCLIYPGAVFLLDITITAIISTVCAVYSEKDMLHEHSKKYERLICLLRFNNANDIVIITHMHPWLFQYYSINVSN